MPLVDNTQGESDNIEMRFALLLFMSGQFHDVPRSSSPPLTAPRCYQGTPDRHPIG